MAARRRGPRKGKVRLSVFSSGNHVVRLAIEIRGFPDASGVAVQPSFDEQAPDRLPPPQGERGRPPRQIAFKKHRQIILKITG